ncbi:alanine racemase [[Brevibacterium] frigoritolerans]|nr:alanine racemase [Peribacillus frigoritolerans]
MKVVENSAFIEKDLCHLSGLSRPTQAIIDLRIYKENMRAIKSTVNKKIMAIVKANAYGNGLVPISKAAEDIIDFFGVAVLEEAMKLRQAEISKPILVLGYVDSEQYCNVVQEGIRVSLYSYEQWGKWKAQIEKYNLSDTLNFHMKLNTGMNRLGFKTPEEIKRTLDEMVLLNNVNVEGVFTHFATADAPNDIMITTQEEKFKELISIINPKDKMIHIANSAYALSRTNAELYDMVRVGISGYGLLPDQSIEKEMAVKTKPILQLKTKIVHIQELSPGETVGYGATFEAKENQRIGVIPIGYADGLLRRYSPNSYVLINGEKRYFAGRICMDQAMVQLKNGDKIGDEVTIYGKQGKEVITLEMAGNWSHSINYEISCLISERVGRIYIK